MPFQNEYTLGRGEIYFARLNPATGVLGGERYIGNTPEFNLTAEEEKLEHFSSDEGIRTKDAVATLQVNYTGTVITDNIDPRNIALFFLGTSEDFTVSQTTITNEQIAPGGVEKGLYYQLGTTTNNPSGARKIIYPGVSGPPDTTFSLRKASTALVLGTDYTFDQELGRVTFLETGSVVVNGDTTLQVTYTQAASKRSRMISGSTAVQGALRYISKNPKGAYRDYFMPLVTLSPNGDFALKGDEWQQIPFNVEVTKKDSTTAAIYGDTRAISP